MMQSSTSSWNIVSKASMRNNCLAYALGSGTSIMWYWPTDTPLLSDVIKEMGTRRWKQVSASEAQIIAYGYGDKVYHFAKKTGSNVIESKWGSFEAVSNNCINTFDAFKTDYGTPLAYFKFY